jgi:hypothetical protein
MRIYCLLSIMFFTLLITGSAQTRLHADADALFQARLSGEVYSSPVLYAGDPYYLSSWTSGRVLLTTGQEVINVMLRYNGYHDDLYWLTPETYQQVRLDKNLIVSFLLMHPESNRWMKFQKIETRNSITGAPGSFFAEVLADERISLYAYRKIRETGETTSAFIGGRLIARQVIGPDYVYYLQIPGSDLVSIQTNRRSLLRVFPEKRKEIRRELRKNHIRIRGERQLIKAVELIGAML